jgi:nucleoside-diphosphate-sugar epimerase
VSAVRLLVIGGTRFVGRHMVDVALARGHEVTLFHRGSGPEDPFPQIVHVHGDRSEGLGGLADGSWDAVIDTCGYLPAEVRTSTEALRDRVGCYLFVSSLSVYADEVRPGATEEDETLDAAPDHVDAVDDATYGPLKVSCERVAVDAFGDCALVLRPGYIVGPNDPTDRFTYWVRRVAGGGEVLAPAPGATRVQFVDARDLALFAIDRLEACDGGVFNVNGIPIAMESFLETCARAAGSDARVVWSDPRFLADAGVELEAAFPIWAAPEYEGASSFDASKAIEAGLPLRPVEQTVRDTLAWDRSRPQTWPMQAGLDPDRERELLTSWLERR